jgi:MATE family multidrug resistance protein
MRVEIVKTMKVALPIILGNIAQMMLGIIDAAMIGAIDYVQLAASALVLNVLGIPYVAAIGMSMSISPLVAIANGEKNQWQVSHYLYNGVILCTVVAALMSGLIVAFSGIIHHIGQEPEVAIAAIPYLKIMTWSVIPMVFFLSLKHFTDALERTQIAMILSFISLPLNAFLNWILIYGKLGFPRLELEGAGWATLITRIIMTIVLLIIIVKHADFKMYIAERKSAWQLRWSSWKELLKIGVPSSLQYGMEVGTFTISGIIVGWFGAVQLAAHQIALSTASLTFMVALGLSQGGSIRVSNAVGMKDRVKIRLIGKSTLILGLVLGGFFALMMVIFHPYIPYLFNQEQQVVELAGVLLIMAAIFQVSDAGQAIGVGLLRGIKDVRVPTFLIAIAYWVIGLPVGYLLGIKAGWEVKGIWIGFIVGLTFSALVTNQRFLKKSTIS